MTLAEYMSANGLKDEDMALRIGCERSYVLKLRKGDARPSHHLMEKVAEKTGGQVQPNDWFDDLPVQEEAA